MMNEGRLRVEARRFLALILCVLLTFGPFYRFGFADDYEGGGGGSHNFDSSATDGSDSSTWGTFWYGPNSFDSDGVKRWKTGVVAYTYWDAALYALGYGKDTVSNISAAKKVKLMNSTTGGSFYTFAKGFQVGRPTEDFGNPVVGFNPTSMLGAWYAARAMYGETYCYWQVYSDDLRSSAKSDANAIIKGGSDVGGGGGGSGGVDDPAAPKDTTVSSDGRYVIIPVEGWKPDPSTQYDAIAVYVECYNALLSAANSIDGVIVAWIGSNELAPRILMIPQSDYEWNESDYSFNYTVAGDCYQYTASRGKQTIDGKVCTLLAWSSSALKQISHGTGSYGYYGKNIYYRTMVPEIDTGGGDDEPHPKDWPKEPVAPSPPELPTPKDPTIPIPPDPVEPVTPDPPDPRDPWIELPDVDVDIQGTDIQAILDAMNEHCIHLQNSIQDNVQQLYELQSTYVIQQFEALRTTLDNDFSALQDYLVDAFSWIGNDVVVSSFSDLKDYLHELFEWLAEQMSYETESYDDTSVLYWLKQIWGKLGAGVNTRPTDPSTDNNGWWEWLTGLLGGLVGALADIGLDKLGGLVDALDTLKDKFPFCIPWDVAALLALLVSEPVAPVVSVPMFALTATDGVQQVGSMTIDLDTYSTAWEAVRWIERIGFCVYLAMRSKDFLDLLGKIKG